MKTIGIMLACCGMFIVAAAAQGPGMGQQPPTLVIEVQRQYTMVSGYAVAAAEQFPEAKYTWQPTPDVRTWAELVAHMTDDANFNCWSIAELPAVPAAIEHATPGPNTKSKAELVAGFHAAIDTCARAIGNITMQNMTDPVGGRSNASKLGQIVTITAHTNEHYGNMVTYMRLQGLVPPSSQGRGAMPAGAPRGGGAPMPGRQ